MREVSVSYLSYRLRFGAVSFNMVFTLFEIWTIDHKSDGTD
jgi:hypothetical protein